jgi:hypothetical protein
MTVEELQQKRNDLIGKIADAVKKTTFADRSTEYGTVDEMEKALQILDNQIAAASNAPRSRSVFVQYSNG